MVVKKLCYIWYCSYLRRYAWGYNYFSIRIFICFWSISAFIKLFCSYVSRLYYPYLCYFMFKNRFYGYTCHFSWSTTAVYCLVWNTKSISFVTSKIIICRVINRWHTSACSISSSGAIYCCSCCVIYFFFKISNFFVLLLNIP